METPPWEIRREIVVKKEEVTDPSYGCPPQNRSIENHLKSFSVEMVLVEVLGNYSVCPCVGESKILTPFQEFTNIL